MAINHLSAFSLRSRLSTRALLLLLAHSTLKASCHLLFHSCHLVISFSCIKDPYSLIIVKWVEIIISFKINGVHWNAWVSRAVNYSQSLDTGKALVCWLLKREYFMGCVSVASGRLWDVWETFYVRQGSTFLLCWFKMVIVDTKKELGEKCNKRLWLPSLFNFILFFFLFCFCCKVDEGVV